MGSCDERFALRLEGGKVCALPECLAEGNVQSGENDMNRVVLSGLIAKNRASEKAAKSHHEENLQVEQWKGEMAGNLLGSGMIVDGKE